MNEKNFEYLSEQLQYTGFGQQLLLQLKENLTRDPNEFRLQHDAVHGKDQMSYSLHFKKSAQGDLYFFNSYTASLKKDNQQPELRQTFYIHKQGSTITQKEAYNLLSGRAVNKDKLISREEKPYSAWIQLDFKQSAASGNFKFKQFSKEYGFDLEKALERLPIRELSEPEYKARLIESLQKGNRQVASLSGSEQQVFLEANPQFKSIIAYDQSQRRLTLDRSGFKQIQGQRSEQQSQNAKQPAAAQDDPAETSVKNRAQRRL